MKQIESVVGIPVAAQSLSLLDKATGRERPIAEHEELGKCGARSHCEFVVRTNSRTLAQQRLHNQRMVQQTAPMQQMLFNMQTQRVHPQIVALKNQVQQLQMRLKTSGSLRSPGLEAELKQLRQANTIREMNEMEDAQIEAALNTAVEYIEEAPLVVPSPAPQLVPETSQCENSHKTRQPSRYPAPHILLQQAMSRREEPAQIVARARRNMLRAQQGYAGRT